MTRPTSRPVVISPKSVAIAAVVAAVATAVVNSVIALAAVGAGVPKTMQLTPTVDVMFSVVASVVGAIGWFLIVRKAANPTATLRWVVPIVLAVSFIPDIALGFATVASTGIAPVLVLAVMHIATITIAVSVYRRFIRPATEAAPAAGM